MGQDEGDPEGKSRPLDRLHDPSGPGVEDIREYLVYDELGLAFDVLVEVGRN